MLYEMLYRVNPQGTFAPPSQRIGCETRIDTIVLKAMQPAPDQRYQSTHEMRAAMASALTPPIIPPQPRFGPSPLPKLEPLRRGLPLLPVAVIIVLSVIGFLLYKKTEPPGITAVRAETTAPALAAALTPPATEEPKPVPSEPTATPAPRPVAAAPATPVPTPTAPQSDTAKWIAVQVPQWQAAYAAAEVSGPFEKGVAGLKQQYLATVK